MNDNMTTATHMFDHSKKLAEAYEKVMQPLCKKLDMPKTALDVLMFLANNPEFNTAGDVCRYRNIKAALVSFHVEKLVEAGFVERQAVKGAETLRVRANNTAEIANPAAGGMCRSGFSKRPVSSIALPSRVSTPKITLSSGIKSSVTAVTSAPAPNTCAPRRKV